MRAILRSSCSWWCSGRFGAVNGALHPTYSAVHTAIRRVTDWDITHSTFIRANLKHLLGEIGLGLVGLGDRGVAFKMAEDEADARVRRAFENSAQPVWSDSDRALHVIRITCRARSLAAAGGVDVEASSAKLWRDWKASLTREDKVLLKVWMCGAISDLGADAKVSSGDVLPMVRPSRLAEHETLHHVLCRPRRQAGAAWRALGRACSMVGRTITCDLQERLVHVGRRPGHD